MQKLAIVAISVIALGAAGCRLKGVEGFKSATTPVDYKNGVGDPYASGGIANATGGLDVTTSYGQGAKDKPTGVLNAKLDQPAKGTGNLPGEQTQAAAAGYGNLNGPAYQPTPGATATR